MPTFPTITPKQATALVSALTAVVVGVALLATSGESVQKYTQVTSEAILDAGMTRDELTDLLTRPVAPGETITTEVVVDGAGRRVDMDVIYFGDALGKFETINIEHIDRDDETHINPRGETDTRSGTTTIRLTAKNVSAQDARLEAYVHFTRGP